MIDPAWHIFPVDIHKRPQTPNGHLDARPSAEWRGPAGSKISNVRSHPDCGWAVSCAASGLMVIDVDPRNGGFETLKQLEAEHGFPSTLAAITGGGGLHFYYRKPEVERFKKTLGPGIDVKVNGYVVLPPSPHASGGRYEWANDCPVAEAPGWLILKVAHMIPDEAYEPIGEAATCFLARAFEAAGWLGREIDAGRVCVTCPWEFMHTTQGSDTSTIVFAPTEGSPLGSFWCSHSSHGRMGLRAVLEALPPDAVARAVCNLTEV